MTETSHIKAPVACLAAMFVLLQIAFFVAGFIVGRRWK
jgi:hypothetical protein